MFFGVLLGISYCSYVFLSEAISPLPPRRYDIVRTSAHAIRRRYLGYWSAFSVLIGGIGSALFFQNSSSQELAISVLMAYAILMIPAVVFYFFKRRTRQLGNLG